MASNSYSARSAEELQQLAVRAAKRVVEDKADITKSVLDIIKEEKGLSQDHIKRICEFTNSTVTQLNMRGNADKTVGFPLVNPDNVISSYFPPEKQPQTKSDYDKSPEEIFKNKEDERKEIQELKDTVKQYITPEEPQANPTYIPEVKKVASQWEELKIANQWVEEEMVIKATNVYTKEAAIKEELRQGMMSGDISLVELEKVAETNQLLNGYIKDVITTMVKTGEIHFIKAQHNLSMNAIEKDAEINIEHPLFKKASELSSDKEDLITLASAREVIQNKLIKVRESLVNA